MKAPSFFKTLRENWWVYALVILAILLLLLQLKSCSSEMYNQGYEAGFKAGIQEGISLVKEDPSAFLN